VLRAEHIYVTYFGDITVLNDVSVDAVTGKITAIIGPNGAGKSTLLKTLFGILTPRRGNVFLLNEDVTNLTPHRRLEKGIVFIPQESSIFPSMSVLENLELAAWIYRNDKEKVKERISRVLESYPRLKERLNTPAGKMSGGEQKMLELGKALIHEPKVLLVDEPTVGLSPAFADIVYEELQRFAKMGITVLAVDQYVDRILEIADTVYYLELGTVRAVGPPSEIRRGSFLFI
jgi:branched-chain amino acid transport system ATP-binding protein